MKTSKTKAPAIVAPQSDDAADLLLTEYGLETRTVAAIQLDLETRVAALKAEYEALAEPHKARLKTIFDQLQAFAAANRDRLTQDGARKTVEFPGGLFGWRLRPPSVRFQRGVKLDDVIAWIGKRPTLKHFLRIKMELNKDAMLDDPAKAAQVEGILIGSAGEDFFIEPTSLELAP